MRALLLLVASLLASLAALPAQATSVVRLAPGEADALAARIVEARVVAARDVEVDGGLGAVEYDLRVERILKDDGSVAAQVAANAGILRIRQLGALDPALLAMRIVGMPRYDIGARYRLALNGDSARGLTSPVGFGQGVSLMEAAPQPPRAGATP